MVSFLHWTVFEAALLFVVLNDLGSSVSSKLLPSLQLGICRMFMIVVKRSKQQPATPRLPLHPPVGPKNELTPSAQDGEPFRVTPCALLIWFLTLAPWNNQLPTVTLWLVFLPSKGIDYFVSAHRWPPCQLEFLGVACLLSRPHKQHLAQW